MNIIITGIAGFVGTSLCEKLIRKKNINIIGIDDLSYGSIDKLKPFIKKIHFIKKDICKLNIKDLLKFKKIDYVIHLAAITPLPDNQINPKNSISTNVAGTANMLEISRALEIKKFIFMSSGAVYERSKESKNGFNEKDKINTLLTYPTSKFFGEKLCDIFNETYNLPVVKIRLFNLYGPRQDYSRKHPAFLAQVLKHLIQDKRLKIYNKNNNIKRDYLYIDDLLRLIYKLLNYKTKNNNLLINACSGDRYSTLDMIKQVEKVAKKKLKIDIDTDPSKFWNKYKNLYQGKYNIKSEIIKNEVFKSAEGDATLLKKIIGKNMTTINKGLRECLRYTNEKLK